MYIIRHRAVNYRNLTSIEIKPCNGVNVVCGLNGQGKTNLLESIFMQTGAKGFRAGKDRDYIKKGELFASVDSEFFSQSREQKISLKISEKGREGSLNGGNTVKASSLVGSLRCVLFSPEHLMLIKGSPDQRRRFIDTSLCQISPKYLDELRRYTRLVYQKNNLLKESRYIEAADNMLDVYDEQIVTSAMLITEMRRDFTDRIASEASAYYDGISGLREKLSIEYDSVIWKNEIDFETGISSVRASRSNDCKLGYCTLGPHRDDMSVSLDGADSRLYASQGQQRSAVLSMKLAEAVVMEKSTGEKPILLLDDVLSELDIGRREMLIENIKHGQAVITCCDPEPLVSEVGVSVFEIEAGSIRQDDSIG